MDLRVTLQTFVNQALAETRQQTDQLTKLQAQAATGQRLTAPSDDPVAAAALEIGNAQSNRLQSYLGNIDTVSASLNQSVSTLQDVSNIFTQAKSIALEGSQSTNDSSSDGALADQVDQLINQLLNDANTQVNGEYLFSGAATQTKPFAVTSTDAQGNPLTIAYQGSTDTTAATVNQNEAVSMNASGQDVFQSPSTNQPGGYDAFQVLIALRDTLRNTTMSSHDQELAISSLAGDIDRVNTNITTATGKQSAVLQNLSQLKTNLQDMQLSVKQTISNLGDTDLSQVVVQLQAQQTMMQLSFYSFSQTLNQSLLEFLK